MMEDSLAALIERFRQVGAGNPESWARSEVDEDIPQFARFIFLRELWKLVTPIGDRKWQRSVQFPNDDGRGGALRRVKEAGASIDDLTAIVRSVQIQTIRDVASILDMVIEPEPIAADVRWGLFELGDDLQPTRRMDGLHESVDDEDVIPVSHRGQHDDGR
jgi:hypothetical protein